MPCLSHKLLPELVQEYCHVLKSIILQEDKEGALPFRIFLQTHKYLFCFCLVLHQNKTIETHLLSLASIFYKSVDTDYCLCPYHVLSVHTIPSVLSCYCNRIDCLALFHRSPLTGYCFPPIQNPRT